MHPPTFQHTHTHNTPTYAHITVVVALWGPGCTYNSITLKTRAIYYSLSLLRFSTHNGYIHVCRFSFTSLFDTYMTVMGSIFYYKGYILICTISFTGYSLFAIYITNCRFSFYPQRLHTCMYILIFKFCL